MRPGRHDAPSHPAPRYVSVFVWPNAIAQYTLGHERHRASVRDRLRRHPGLSVCGTSYDGVSFNHAVKSGRLVALQLAEQLWSKPSQVVIEPAGAMAGA